MTNEKQQNGQDGDNVDEVCLGVDWNMMNHISPGLGVLFMLSSLQKNPENRLRVCEAVYEVDDLKNKLKQIRALEDQTSKDFLYQHLKINEGFLLP